MTLVVPGSPAETAGLKPGDVIVSIDDVPTPNDERASYALVSSNDERRQVTWVSPDGDFHTASARRFPAPALGLVDYLHDRAANRGDPISRLLFARVSDDPEVGIDIASQLTRDLPTFPDAFAALADLTFRRAVAHPDPQGAPAAADAAAAEAAAERATELDPNSASHQSAAAELFLATKKPERAEAHALLAVSADDFSAQAHELLGRSRLELKREEEALPDLHRALELAPYQADYYSSLIDGYRAVDLPALADQTQALFDELRGIAQTRAGDPGSRQRTVGLTIALVCLLGGGVGFALRRRGPEETDAPPAAHNWALGLLEAQVVIGMWVVLMPFTGPAFGMPGDALRREVVGLVIPGALLLATSAFWARRLSKRSNGAVPVPDWVAGLQFLCGLWLGGAHARMATQVHSGKVSIDVAVFHVLPSVPVMVLAAWTYIVAGRAALANLSETDAPLGLEGTPSAG